MKAINLKIPYIAVAILSLLALMSMPYGYYMFLRLVVTVVAAIAAYQLYNKAKMDALFWASIGIALLFNPVIPIHLTREIWSIFNVLVAGFFAFLAYKEHKISS